MSLASRRAFFAQRPYLAGIVSGLISFAAFGVGKTFVDWYAGDDFDPKAALVIAAIAGSVIASVTVVSHKRHKRADTVG